MILKSRIKSNGFSVKNNYNFTTAMKFDSHCIGFESNCAYYIVELSVF